MNAKSVSIDNNGSLLFADATHPGDKPAVDKSTQQLIIEALREENAHLRSVQASRPLGAEPVVDDRRPPVTAEHILANRGWGEVNAMTREQILTMTNAPLDTSDNELDRLFGSNGDPQAAQALARTNPYRLRCLREAAKLLKKYGGDIKKRF